MSSGAAVAAILIVYALGVAITLAVAIYILRQGVEPLRRELARIADELELQGEIAAGEGDE